MAVAQINVGFQVQIKELAEKMNQAAEILEKNKAKFTEIGNSIGQAGMYVGRYVDQMAGTVITSIGGIVSFIPEIMSAISKLNALIIANPWIALATAITAAGTALYFYTRKGSEAMQTQKMLNDINVEALKNTAKERAELDSLLKLAKDDIALKKDRLDAIKKLNDISPKYLGDLDLESINTKKSTEAIGLYINALNSKARAQALVSKKTELFQKQMELSMEGLGETGMVQDAFDKLWRALGKETPLISSREALEKHIKAMNLSEYAANGMRLAYEPHLKQREKDVSFIQKQIDALDDYAKAEQNAGDSVVKSHENSETAIREKIKTLRDQRSGLDMNSEKYKELSKTIEGYEKRLKTSETVTKAAKKNIVATEGTILFYEQQINAIKDFQNKVAASTDEYGEAAERIAAIQSKIDALTGKRENQVSLSMNIEPIKEGTLESYNRQIQALEKLRDGFPLASFAWQALDNQIKDIEFTIAAKVDEGSFALATDGIARLTQEVGLAQEATSDAMARKQEEAMVYADVVSGAFESFGEVFISSLGESSNALEQFGIAMMEIVIKVIAMGLAQSMANSVVIGTETAKGFGPAAAFALPALLAASMGLVLSAFSSVPKFADGGVVFGPTLGLMGEYAGAANNPEVIAPLSKLKDLIEPAGKGDTYITLGGGFKISGNELQLILDRNSTRNKRVR